jgi:APA family basic amino acid/polyamine antiporter
MTEKQDRRSIELVRQIGLITAIACMVGSMIASGIFKKPAFMASQLSSPELLILVWVVAGIMTLFGTLNLAEVSCMFPESGGQYVYLSKAYNPFVGFLYGWGVFAIIQTGSIASIAYVFSDSLGYFVHFPRFSESVEAFAIHIPLLGAITPFKAIGLKLCTIALLLFLTTTNYLGVKIGGAVQVTFTILKVLAIAVIMVFAFTSSAGDATNFTQSAAPSNSDFQPVFLAFIMAMAGAFWAYDGWQNVAYVGGEVKNPQKNFPKALLIGMLIVIAVYVLANLAYIYIVPTGEMGQNYLAGEKAGQTYLVGAAVGKKVMGASGGAFIAIAIMLSTFGAVNGTTMMSARVPFAMARQGHFFRKLGEVNPRFKTPGPALIAQGIWASLLVLSGTFDQLTNMVIFMHWIFYAAGAYSVILLRKKMPDIPRPYKVWGYPVIPILFIVFAIIYVAFTLYGDIDAYIKGQTPLINSLMGLLLVALGIPFYLYWNRKKKRIA